MTEHGPTTPLPPIELPPGATLGAYELGDVIGRGGMGVVYRARHVRLERVAALKVLSSEVAADPAFRERFMRESRIAASLQHPSIVTVYDAGDQDGLLYIAMQYVEGTDLALLLERVPCLELEQAVRLLEQIADALDAAHALGLVHRDVKPGNIMVAGERAYLTDFGLTKYSASKTALTQHGSFVGTVGYMAPEQVEGRQVDARADVYALGCVFFHAVTGAPPFRRESPISEIFAHVKDTPPTVSQVRQGLPPALDGIVAKALAKRPADRWETCGAFLAAARAACGGDAGPVQAVAALPRRVAAVVLSGPESALVRLTLAEAGFDVGEAASLQEAVEAHNEPDVVVVDWKALLDGGAPAVAQLRAHAPRTKVIACVPRAEAVDSGAVTAAGADGYVESPFSSLQLRYAVEDVLSATASSTPPAA